MKTARVTKIHSEFLKGGTDGCNCPYCGESKIIVKNPILKDVPRVCYECNKQFKITW